ncbi:transcriptional regulator [Parapedobacter pyrenivorans]|uniref:Transcriptional regulator n=1 Tax=Parapedobacter pyrenivorans TaxID=1305674 RepID=A0A917HH01_9SPHI|nr:helix-turn-helix domain-containing protein [Parapedobacter pyrenivorans]GGG79367.1 transcriptional regulator [Parapedobacter pyrenivorans]
MKQNLNLRSLYTPVQPAIKGIEQHVSYIETLPDERLQQYIYCYWFLKTDEQMQSPYIYNVVADGCIDIVFDLNDPSSNFVMGFCNRNNEFVIDKSFNAVGIRFLPAMFTALFHTDALEFYNTLVPLNLFLKIPSQFIENSFAIQDSNLAIKGKLDNFFLKIISKNAIEIDFRFQVALTMILRNCGAVKLNSDLAIGLSQRQLRRYFELHIGASPKAFSQVVRFQNMLKAGPSLKNTKTNKLFYDFGYYDQSHFINEYKRFYGCSPTKSLR